MELTAPNIGYDDWDPFAGRIYSNNIGAGNFVTASSVALFGTPGPKYDPDTLADAKVIGLIQDWNVSQTKQSPQLFECGSDGRYTLSTGRVAGTLQMSRVIYNGSNLLYLLYAGRDPEDWSQIHRGSRKAGYTGIMDIAGYHIPDTRGFLINLGSSMFLKPLGVIIVLRTASAPKGYDKDVAGFFLEDCYISSHGMGASAGAPYVGEQVALSYEAVYPIDVSTDDTMVELPTKLAAVTPPPGD